MSRVLVTGGAGTIGTAVVRRLLGDPDFEVRVSDQRPAPDWMREGCEVHTGDLRSLDEARRAIRGCSHVIHLAAIVGGIANFHKLPHTLTEVNNALYNAVFRAALDEAVERCTYVSSSMVFERAEQFPTREDYLPDCPVPRSAYGFSKLTGEVYVRAAHDEHGLPFTICRPFNAYGPGELPDDEPGIAHAVPDLIRKSLQRLRPLPIFGTGEHTRTLTHVDDIADGIVTATAHPAGRNEDFNISAGDELTVAEIAHLCWAACGNDPHELEFEHLPSFEVDVARRWPSVEKAERLIGWRARIGVEDGIRATAEWLRIANPRSPNVRPASLGRFRERRFSPMMKPNAGRALSAAGATLLLVSLALVWYHVDRPTGTTSSTGWDTFPRLRFVLVGGALITLATALAPQVRWVLIVRTVVGLVVAALILRRIIDPPELSVPVHSAIGVYVGFVAALMVAAGGLVDTGRRVAAEGGLGFGRPASELPPPSGGGAQAEEPLHVPNLASRR